jgi:hypothetical protein
VSNSHDMSRLGPQFLHVKFMLHMAFTDSCVGYCPRACKKPSHKLAALGVECETVSPRVWMTDFPPNVMPSVTNDLVVP